MNAYGMQSGGSGMPPVPQNIFATYPSSSATSTGKLLAQQHLVRCQLPVLRVLLRCCCHPRRYHPLVMALVRSVGVSRAVDVLQRVVLYMPEAVHCIQRALRIAAQRMSGVDMPPHQVRFGAFGFSSVPLPSAALAR